MNTLVFGAGAIGTYIGGNLLKCGCQVVFIERDEGAQILQNEGLFINSERIPNPIVTKSIDEALGLCKYEVAIFALKSYDTEGAIQEMGSYDLPPILCLQNGVENEIRLRRILTKDKVIPGTVTTAIGRHGLGNIQIERLRGLGIYSGNPISSRLFEVFKKAGLHPQLFNNAESMKWSKMLTNLPGNASSAILSMSPKIIYSHPELIKLEIAQLREALAIMDALHIQVINLPRTPVKVLAFGIKQLPINISTPLLRRAIGGGRGNKMPSFYIDLQAGRNKSEVEDLNGAIVRYGRQLGIPTPANLTLTETLLEIVNDKSKAEDFIQQPQKLIARFKDTVLNYSL